MNTMTISKRFVLDVDPEIRAALRELIGEEQVVLASGSPRRREILRLAGLECRVVVPNVDESVPEGVDPVVHALTLAFAKMVAVPNDGSLTVAADTIVVLNNEILGKPENKADAHRILSTLSGHQHSVITALAIRDSNSTSLVQADKTFVTFREFSDAAISAYIDSGEPMDKAGAYGIQGMGELLVESLEGSLHNVIGFPIELFVRMMRELRA